MPKKVDWSGRGVRATVTVYLTHAFVYEIDWLDLRVWHAAVLW